jgi:hypothetical protein
VTADFVQEEEALDVEREQDLLHALETCGPFDGLHLALKEVIEFHPDGVIEALLRGARDREPDVAIQFAAMLFFLHGKADSDFDWSHRGFFLRFDSDGEERAAVFDDLCSELGIDSAGYLGR